MTLSTRIRNYGNVCWRAQELSEFNCIPYVIFVHTTNSGKPASPSGPGGAALSALSLGLVDGTASPAASLLASKAAAAQRIRHRNYEHEY